MRRGWGGTNGFQKAPWKAPSPGWVLPAVRSAGAACIGTANIIVDIGKEKSLR